jgi:DsbC/DsbD-like thiol-disulfide interchange protein
MSCGGMTHITNACEVLAYDRIGKALRRPFRGSKFGREKGRKIAPMVRVVWLVSLLFALVGVSLAQAPETQVSLVSTNSTVKAGSSEMVGVRFQVPPGWHMYWVNPGDAGEPPKAQWNLPAGWSAGDFRWPTPARMVNAAGVDYGYEGDVMLLTPMKVGTAGGDLTANLRWLICKDVCVPQKGTAQLAVKAGTNSVADPAGAQVIAAAKAKLPKPTPDEWKANGFQNPGQVILNFRPGIKVQDAAFFPQERDVIENAAPQKLSSTSYAAQLTLKKADTSAKIHRLKGVLVINGASAYEIDVPVK